MDSGSKPHAVCIPFPAQGHITPLLKLSKLLHNRGFHITFVNTDYNHRRLIQSNANVDLHGRPDFRFETIPDGLPPTDANTTQHIPSLCESTSKNCLVPFRNLLDKLNHTSGKPPVTCIVSDGIMSFTHEASKELGIPNMGFWTTSACGFLGYKQCVNLMDKGVVPFKDSSYLTNGYLETMVEWIPGKKCIRMKDLPILIRTTDPNNIITNFLKQEMEAASRASAIILNTFEELERDVVDALSSMFPCKIYSIGPLQLHLDQIKESSLEKIGSSLWKEEDGCIEWLNSKEPKSVVYVNFGSLRVLTKAQLVELAWGIANSQQNFLWIVRPDLVLGGIEALPTEFIADTKERGLLASWCQQERVLRHPAVGGFLTHSGWNSTIECMTAGVPMICWPFSSEQRTNSLYVCTDWGIGKSFESDDVDRITVEKMVRELVEGDDSDTMKEQAMKWKRKALHATYPGGSSYLNLERLVDEVLQFNK